VCETERERERKEKGRYHPKQMTQRVCINTRPNIQILTPTNIHENPPSRCNILLNVELGSQKNETGRGKVFKKKNETLV
jgi:hypothetical protein